jgi:hypothetical protein
MKILTACLEPEPQPVLKPPVQADQSPKSPMRESKQRKFQLEEF